MARRAARGLDLAIALAALAVAFCSTASAQSRSHHTVLTVHWGSEDFPINPVLDASIRDALLSRPSADVEYYAEYLESETFPPEEASLALRDYIDRKYRGRKIDVVMASTDAALEFVLRFRRELFPDAAVVYRGASLAEPALRQAGAGLTGIRNTALLTDTLRLALKLHPATERVLVVAQAPSARLQESWRAEFSGVAHPVAIDVIAEESLSRLIAAIKAVPRRSVILYVRYSQQVPGHVLMTSDVARLVAEASPVPVYGVLDLYVGSGVVGGVVYQTRAIGTRMGQMANQILDGTRPHEIPLEQGMAVPVFDWRQLRRWGISENQLPGGSTILFREPGVWELYWPYILGSALLVIAQSALIAGLIVQRVRRRRTERALRDSERRFRETAEQNQDLAGRLINAQEAERTRIARDLHDDVSQQLAGLAIMLSGLKRKLGQPRSDAEVVQTVRTLQERTTALANSVRNISHELHPGMLQHAGLFSTLQRHCADIEQHHQLKVSFSAKNNLDTVTPDVVVCLYRVAQETLTNAVRHARARTILVQLAAINGGVELKIEDDGVGFVASERTRNGLGLRSMGERVRLVGGNIQLESQPGHGTRLLVWIPHAQGPNEVVAETRTSLPT